MDSFKMHARQVCAFSVSLFVVTNATHAAITGLHVESTDFTDLVNVNLTGMQYNIYVQFDDPTDRIVSMLDGDLSFVGGNLVQIDDVVFNGDTDLGEHQSALDPLAKNLAADSYVQLAGADSNQTPAGDGDWDGAAFAAGTGITGGWFVSPPTADDLAVDANNRVLVMVLGFEGAGLPVVNGIITTNDGGGVFSTTVLGDLIQGTIRTSYNPQGVAGGITGVTWNFKPVPAPGALALLGVAGMLGKRRRRAQCD